MSDVVKLPKRDSLPLTAIMQDESTDPPTRIDFDTATLTVQKAGAASPKLTLDAVVTTDTQGHSVATFAVLPDALDEAGYFESAVAVFAGGTLRATRSFTLHVTDHP